MTAARNTSRRELLRAGLGAVIAFPSASLGATAPRLTDAARLIISDHYSPRNQHRPLRPHTLYIVLHTTEGAEQGSLDKIWRQGEAHYFVPPDGHVLRIIDRSLIATHAGRSMWEGHHNLDDYAIGIEVVGYHNQDITAAEYTALRELLRQLKEIYGITDDRILTHSMVAYGSPNQFHPNDHRGRKRCAMIFARPDVRLKLGLLSRPAHDADVEAGRLVVGDVELYKYLFAPAPAAAAAGALTHPQVATVQPPKESDVVTKDWTPWHIARERFNRPETTYVFPDGKRLRGDQIGDWNRIPEGTRVIVAAGEEEQAMEGFLEIGKDGDSARALAGNAFDRDTTIYFLPNGLIRTGRELKNAGPGAARLDHLPQGTKVLTGYINGGSVMTRRLPSSIAGIKWNYPSTFYRFPDGRIVSGDEIEDTAIPAHTLIFFRN